MNLDEELERLEALDAKRTQGVITTDRDKQRPMITTPYGGHHCFTPADVAYYNNAPAMMTLLRAFAAENKAQREVIEKLVDALSRAPLESPSGVYMQQYNEALALAEQQMRGE